MRDVMVDIETLGTKAGSVILSIGAVAFDRVTGEISPTQFHVPISIASSVRLGATIDADTIRWWRDQSPEAQTIIWRALSGGEDLLSTLNDFGIWLNEVGAQGTDRVRASMIRVWGNGADFDNVLIAAACAQAGRPLPWNNFNNRCFRTLKDDHRDLEPVRQGVHHDALADAIHQARWACAILMLRQRALSLYDRALNPTAADVRAAA